VVRQQCRCTKAGRKPRDAPRTQRADYKGTGSTRDRKMLVGPFRHGTLAGSRERQRNPAREAAVERLRLLDGFEVGLGMNRNREQPASFLQSEGENRPSKSDWR
jgi:hypothetical protein